jgi:hypothetical protein
MTGFFQIPFDDDERCGLVAVPAMTRAGRITGFALLA